MIYSIIDPSTDISMLRHANLYSMKPQGGTPSVDQAETGASAAQAAAGHQLSRDHVALDLVGALADDHQRRVAEVPLDVILGRVPVPAVNADRVEGDLHGRLR